MGQTYYTLRRIVKSISYLKIAQLTKIINFKAPETNY